jgi:hypothetical protein
MTDPNKLDFLFDDLLFQTQRGRVTHEQLERGVRFDQFEQVREWRSKYGYKFNIYGNDHLIDNKPHFHFDHTAEGIKCKMDFDGNVLESSGTKEVPANILKELRYFLSKQVNKALVTEMWNLKNPSLTI